MKIYFPQWQGSGTGTNIEPGAKTVLDYLNDDSFVSIPLSHIHAGKEGLKKNSINNYDAIVEQLSRFKRFLDTKQPKTCLLYTSPSPRDRTRSRMPSSA